MPNDKIIAEIEELKRICDPNETEAKLVHELKQISSQIASIQSELSELKNIPDTLFYDEIQESRDSTTKIELQKQIRELEKKVSILEMELKELKTKEAEQYKLLESLQQNKNQNVDISSALRDYEKTLESSESKGNMNTILTEVKKKADEDTRAFSDLEANYKALQKAIEEKATDINSIKEDIDNYQKQMEQISNDLVNREKYINQEKKNENTAKIAELEKELVDLTEQQTKIVENPIMIISSAYKAAIAGDLVTALNKLKAAKELLLQKPFMDIPEVSFDETLSRYIEERNAFYNKINGKDYTLRGLPAAAERIDEMNANIARWFEEVDILRARKEEIDNGTKYGTAKKIIDTNEAIQRYTEEIAEFKAKESLTSDEEVAIDKREKEIEGLKEVLNNYFADQKANIKEALSIKQNIEILEERMAAAKAEIKELGKMSRSLAGIDIMSKKNDNDKLQEYVNKVMDLKKLPEYRRMLVIVDEILDSLGKDIVVPTIEEKEEALVTGEPNIQQVEITKEEPIAEIHPIEDVKADEINIELPLAEAKEEIVTAASTEIKPEPSNVAQEKASGVVFEPAFKEEVASTDTNVLNGTANKVIASEEINPQLTGEVKNPFANISDLKTVESPQKGNAASVQTPPASVSTSSLKVENQEKVVAFPTKETVQTASIESTKTPEAQDISQQSIEQPSTSSIDDFFAKQWKEANENAPTLGKVA